MDQSCDKFRIISGTDVASRFEMSQGAGYLNMAFSAPQLEQATGVEPQLTSRAPMSPQDTLASAEHGELL